MAPKYDAKDMVLAKMAGYPAWPAFVMPQDQIPPLVLKVKKKSAAYCVIFIPDGDFYWMAEKQLDRLTREKLLERVQKIPLTFKRGATKKKSGRTTNINDAFLAAEDADFDSFMELVFAEDDEDDEEDEMNGDEEDEEEEEEEEPVPAKPKTKANGRDTTDSTPTPPRNGKRKGDAAAANAKKPKTEKPPSEEDIQKQLWQCRIKLQRSLIQRNQPTTPKDTLGLKPPTADELSMARFILNKLADFPVSTDLLRQTKIHKVLKCIVKDPDLEYPDLFQLHRRSDELLTKWDDHIQELRRERAQK